MNKIRIGLSSHGKYSAPTRKTMSEGRVYLGGEEMLREIVEIIRSNKEAWIGTEELGGIRVVGMLDTGFKFVKPWSQVVGKFKDVLKAVKWEIVGKSPISIGEAKNRAKAKADIFRKGYELKNVTPDTMITFACEKCGHPNTVRVGRKLV